MSTDTIFGIITMGVCIAGIHQENAWYVHSRFGHFLSQKYGEGRGRMISRLMLSTGVFIGMLIALGILTPWRWGQ